MNYIWAHTDIIWTKWYFMNIRCIYEMVTLVSMLHDQLATWSLQICSVKNISHMIITEITSDLLIMFLMFICHVRAYPYLVKPPWIDRSIFVRTKFSVLELGKMYYNYNCIMPIKEMNSPIGSWSVAKYFPSDVLKYWFILFHHNNTQMDIKWNLGINIGVPNMRERNE